MIIAIDGPSGVGKGTLAKNLEKALGYKYLDTGALYRAVALYMIERDIDCNQEQLVCSNLENITEDELLKLTQNPKIRDEKTSINVSVVAVYKKVRAFLHDFQVNFAKDSQGAILDGRDIGTVICPNADIKLFVTASPEVRAIRRHKENKEKGLNSSYQEVFKQLKIRDERDAERDIAPAKPADDAIIIDTSNLSREQVLEKAMKIIKNKS